MATTVTSTGTFGICSGPTPPNPVPGPPDSCQDSFSFTVS